MGTGTGSRDLSPIAVDEKTDSPTSKIPAKASKAPTREHKVAPLPLAKKLNLQLHDDIGKYRVFAMHFHYAVSNELPGVKGIYWNKNQKIYMVQRDAEIKTGMINGQITNKAKRQIARVPEQISIKTEIDNKNENSKKV